MLFRSTRGSETPAPGDVSQRSSRVGARSGLRGWLLVYMVALGLLTLPGLGLTVGAVLIYADPARAGMTSSVPLASFLTYVVTNVVLVVYGAILLILMLGRRKAVIVNSVVFALLSVLSLVLWRFLGEKSGVGTVVHSLFPLVGVVYVLSSKRARSTLVLTRRPRRRAAGMTGLRCRT